MSFMFFSSGYRFTQAVALFSIGIILGAIMATLSIGHQLDRLHSTNQELAFRLSEKEDQIVSLEEKISEAQRWLTVQEIEVKVNLPDRNFADKQQLQLELNKQVSEMLKSVRGKRVKELDAQVVWQIVENRKVEASGYHFNLVVKAIIISEKLVFEVDAIYIDPQKDSEPVFY